MRYFNKLQDSSSDAPFNLPDGKERPAVYVVWTGSPNAANANVRGVYGDAHEAADACAALINRGSPAQMSGVMISTPGKIGSDGAIWLYSGTGDATFAAFGDMDAADAWRKKLGGQVRAFQVIGWAGKKAVHAGDLRKAIRGLTPEVIRKCVDGAPVETAKASREFIKLAQKRPFAPGQFYGRG